ncbi:hypothetical protein [Thermostaphylospora chromogena]|uniref:Peptide chain release factor 1 (ERF1) n=1 Tax=Thermostaphylospora chromogena TaxID=35622 RepID=A0A1H1CSA8_9ACTN|nr:hypothetical protein [Thermostaphylospora chromogena]SDQ67104.1 hypothetical protein SAMN04489764_1621 [Thermostaphylospora chromogena]
MRLHTDIPNRADIDALVKTKAQWCVSLYLPTSPTSLGDAERIELGNLTREALDRLRDAGADKDETAAVEEQLATLTDDDWFWRYQARTLAVFATPSSLATFRLPNRLARLAVAADRFYIKPLLRAVTFPQTAFVLALAAGSVRVLEITPDGLESLAVPGMPTDLESAVGKETITDRASLPRLHGGEGRKVRIRQFVRQVEHALRRVLPERNVPLILAATEPLDSIFRSVCGYPDLAPITIPGSPESLTDDELLTQARQVLDRFYADQLRELHELFEERSAQGRTAVDIADAARFATVGAIDTVFFDIDAVVPGYVDEKTGTVIFGETDGRPADGVVDEIVRRVWLTGGRVLAVRREDVPGGGDVAAILRYTPA